MKEYITIAELSNIANISKIEIINAISQKNSKLFQYVVSINGKFHFKSSVLKELYGIEIAEEQPKKEEQAQPVEIPKTKGEQLELIEVLKAQIAEKDKQINTLLSANLELTKKLSEIMSNAQALQAQANYLLLGNNAPPMEQAPEQPQPIEEEKQKPKSNIFIKFFNWLND